VKGKREYTIERGAPDKKWTDEEVFKYKDYGKLTANYEEHLQRIHKKPLYKDPKALIALILIVVVAFLVFKSVQEEKAGATPEEQVEPTTAD